jgi:Copper amine oxidase N-terminal domain
MLKRIILLCMLSLVPASAITVEVNGRLLPSQPAPIMDGGRVLVPMRAVFNALGAQVEYQAGQITAHRSGKEVRLALHSSAATLNGTAMTLESPPRLVAGHTYVPLRFVSQALGESVAWESSIKKVVVGDRSVATTHPNTPHTHSAALDLKRLAVGNQGGVLKVWDSNKSQVMLYRGLDDRSTAPLSATDRHAILNALSLPSSTQTASLVMADYNSFPQKEAIALLGVVNNRADVRRFLIEKMRNSAQVVLRRQAVLALAVGEDIDAETVDAVLGFYEASDNLWESFPVQQFFEYHSHKVQALPNYPEVRTRVARVNSLYRDNILSYLN